MVLYQFHTRKFDFVVIPPQELLSRYDTITNSAEVVQSYISVTKQKSCWETRGLGRAHIEKLCAGTYQNPTRDLTRYLNAWPLLETR